MSMWRVEVMVLTGISDGLDTKIKHAWEVIKLVIREIEFLVYGLAWLYLLWEQFQVFCDTVDLFFMIVHSIKLLFVLKA